MLAQEEQYAEIEIDFRETVQPGAGVRVVKDFIRAGKITKVMFHFPPGCAAPVVGPLVDVRLEKDGRNFYPRYGFIALDSATPVYQCNVSYYSYEPLTLIVNNKDRVNPHTITCQVVIRYKVPEWMR
ncbi:hypothetical protein ES702_02482 [subsurface metagenome]